jgi:hypothetical protein
MNNFIVKNVITISNIHFGLTSVDITTHLFHLKSFGHLGNLEGIIFESENYVHMIGKIYNTLQRAYPTENLFKNFFQLLEPRLKGTAWSIRRMHWPCSIYGDPPSTEVRAFMLLVLHGAAQSCCEGSFQVIEFVFIQDLLPSPTVNQSCQCEAILSPPHR